MESTRLFFVSPAIGEVRTTRPSQRAEELELALGVLSSFDEGPDLVLFFKHMMVLKGHPEYTLNFNETDALSDSQRGFVEAQLRLFDVWYADWSKQPGAVQRYAA